MRRSDPAKIIDHTNIEPDVEKKDIRKTCTEAKKYKFRGVCVNPKWVGFAAGQLEGRNIKVVALVDPPMGLSPHFRRLEKAKKAKIDGANEIDVVMNIIDMKYERYDEILEDLKEICKILPTKIIIGSGYLTDGEIEKASTLAKKAGAFCVKTATEKDPLEHLEIREKAKHLGIMKKGAPGLKIKASGKIRTYKDLKTMTEAGADIIGTSSSVKIIGGYKKSQRRKKKK